VRERTDVWMRTNFSLWRVELTRQTSVGKTCQNYLQLGSCALRGEIHRWNTRHGETGCKERRCYRMDNYQVNTSFNLLKTNSCTYFKTLFYIHIKTLKIVKMFCKKRHYKNSTCFGPYSMTIFRGRPSFLVHLLPFSCLLRHLSFFGFVVV
jgi:hypothetical protein